MLGDYWSYKLVEIPHLGRKVSFWCVFTEKSTIDFIVS